MIVAAVSSVAGLGGAVALLATQGLDRAEKWTSLVGVFVSVAIGVAGLALGWATWRQGAGPSGRVSRTGDATATGAGSVAVSGSRGTPSGTAVDRTGDATARGGGHAVSGDDRTAPRP